MSQPVRAPAPSGKPVRGQVPASRRKGASRNREEMRQRREDMNRWTRTVHANPQDF